MKLRPVGFPGFVVFLCAVLTFGAKTEEKHAVSPEDLVGIRDVSDVQISPDGKRVVFVISEPADPKKPKKARDSDIWIVPADGSEPARPFAASRLGCIPTDCEHNS